jgi:hypothetical protein
MEEPSDQRHFHCDHCNGRIAIPYDLPVTIAPCPHCQLVITSPPPPQLPGSVAAPAPRPKPVLSENSGWVKAWSPPVGQNSGRVATLAPLGQNSGRVVTASPLGQNGDKRMAVPGPMTTGARAIPPVQVQPAAPGVATPLNEGRVAAPSPLNQSRVAPVGARGAGDNRVTASSPSAVVDEVSAAPAAVANRAAPVAVAVSEGDTAKVKLNPISLWLATAKVKLIAPKKGAAEEAAPMSESERIQSSALPAHVGPSIAMRGASQEVEPRPTKLGQETMLVRARLERFNLVPVKKATEAVNEMPEAEKAAPATAAVAVEPQAKPKSRKRLLMVAAVVPVVLAAGGIGFLSYQDSVEPLDLGLPKPTAAQERKAREKRAPEETFISRGWKDAAMATLGGFLAAPTVEGKIPLVVPESTIAERMDTFYLETGVAEEAVPVDGFRAVELTEKDRRRGIFLMVFNQPAAEGDQPADPVRVLAFFKRADDKLLLDWDTFIQTRHKMFKRFVDARELGELATFRVMIGPVKEDGAATAGVQKVAVWDPAYPEIRAVVEVASDSVLGKELAMQPLSDAGRSATLELGWDDEKAPHLRVSEFICWEFAGLGSQPIGPGR